MGWAHNVQSWHLHVRMPGVALLVVAVIVPVGGVLATATVLWVVEQSQLSPGGRLSRTRGPAPAFANAGPWWWLQVRRTKTCPTQDVCGASPDGAGDHTCNVESVATECHATTDQNGPQKYHYDSGPSRDAVPVAIWLHLIHETPSTEMGAAGGQQQVSTIRGRLVTTSWRSSSRVRWRPARP